MNFREGRLSPSESSLWQELRAYRINGKNAILENDHDRSLFSQIGTEFPSPARVGKVSESGEQVITYGSDQTPKQLRERIKQIERNERKTAISENK